MTPPFSERFWDTLCSAKAQFQFLLVFDVTMLVLAVIAIPLVERGTTEWVLLQLDLLIFGVALVFVLAVLGKCRARQTKLSGD